MHNNLGMKIIIIKKALLMLQANNLRRTFLGNFPGGPVFRTSPFNRGGN